MKNTLQLVLFFLLAVSLSGCAGKYTEPQRYSGFLNDYSHMKPERSASGVPVLRWTSSSFKTSDYDSIYISPVIFWPAPPILEQAEKGKLQAILDYTNTKLRQTLKSSVPVVDKPGTRTLTLRPAITAVDLQKQGLNVWEIMPVSVLIAGAQYLTGYRTLDVIFYFEIEVNDSLTHIPLITAIRRSQSATISNSHKKLTLGVAKETIDELVNDLSIYRGSN
ncbi:DUF3313 domain-containing protein [Serratia fonticola]|uniref:DUF3313 domain-containing protein n=1 Tax=Serratia fonticola TaxID=47917 RepID=UPI0015C6293A|nr:DUF3313 domain-containing protein [Serratia fonticola]MBC3377821.1 DUF3313 domain-containing protein [Serratia fonticola]NYA37021.1 DUF3313 domain-containing protein [Serratia fonticola]